MAMSKPRKPHTALAAGKNLAAVMPTPTELLSRRLFYVLFASLFVMVLAVYWPSLHYQFVLDDHGQILDNPRVQSPGFVATYFTQDVWGAHGGKITNWYRPLFLLWLRLDYILYGLSPWGWHLGGILIHLLATALLAALVWMLTGNRVGVLLAAGLFALHPAKTESVAWVSAITDPLMTVGVLSALLLCLKYQEPNLADVNLGHKKTSNRRWPSVWWLIGSVACYSAALLAKEPAVILPVVVFALALARPRVSKTAAKKGRAPRSRVSHAFLTTSPFLVVTTAYLVLRWHVVGALIAAEMEHLPRSTVLLSWPAALWFYVRVLIWPVRMRAFADSPLANAFSLRGILLPAVGVAGVVVLCGVALRKILQQGRRSDQQAANVKAAVVVGGLLLVLPILPALNLNALMPGDLLCGRYSYLPSAGLAILLAAGWQVVDETRRRKAGAAFLSAAGIVALVFLGLTLQQESAWADDLSLWSAAHQVAPHNWLVAWNLASELRHAGRNKEAVAVYQGETEQHPDNGDAWIALSGCYIELGDLANAERSLERAAQLKSDMRIKMQLWNLQNLQRLKGE